MVRLAAVNHDSKYLDMGRPRRRRGRGDPLVLFGRLCGTAALRNLRTDLTAWQGSATAIVDRAGSGRFWLLSSVAESARNMGVIVSGRTFSPAGYPTTGNGASIVGRPRLICVDNLEQATDEETRTVLRLAARAQETGTMLVVTLRPTCRGTTQNAPTDLLVSCGRISLAPLAADAAVRLAAARGLTVDDATAIEILSLARENTSLVGALLEDHVRKSSDSSENPEVATAGASYRRAVARWCRGHEVAVNEAVEAGTVLGRSSAPQDIAVISERDVETVCEAVFAGFVEPGTRHPFIAQTTGADRPPLGSAALSIRAASALRRIGAPAIEVASHLIAADFVDDEWIDYLLEVVGDDAGAQREPSGQEVVIGVMRLALRNTRDTGRRAEILLRLARAHAASDPDLAGQYFHEAGSLLSPLRLWLDYHPEFGDHMAARGAAQAAVEGLEMAANALADGYPVRRVELEASRLLLCSEFPELLSTSASLLPHPADGVRGGGPRVGGARGATLAGDDPDDGTDGADDVHPGAVSPVPRYLAARSLVSTLVAGPDEAECIAAIKEHFGGTLTERGAPAALAALTSLTYAGELVTARSLVEEYVEDAATRHMPFWAARFLAVKAEIALRQGDYADAAAAAGRALGTVPARAWGVRLGGPLSCLLLVATVGEADPDRWLAHPVPSEMFDSRYGLHYLYACGQVKLTRHRAHAAQADFRSCGRMMSVWGIDRENIVPWRLAAAGAALALGDSDRAVDLIGQRLDQHRSVAEGRLCPKSGENDLERRRIEREELFHLVATAVQRGSLVDDLRRLGVTPAPPPPAARYRIEDRYSAYLDKLTSSERRVAVLAAKGRSNQSIARALSVTISTVEQHLTRIYRKLNLRGRQELRAKLG
jgi:DNA-binding CsgD family transcriptional regulator